jgi:hypothetical protein
VTTGFEYQRPYLYPKQLESIFAPERYSVIEASTKAGKTVGCLVWLFEGAIAGTEGQNFWWVAPVKEQSEIAYTRMKIAIAQQIPYEKNDTRKFIDLPNGARMWFKSGERPDTLYGENVWRVVIDEASRVKSEAWYAIRSTLTYTRGPARIIGNVKGRKNWAYKLGVRAKAGEEGLVYSKITCWDAVEAGVLPREEVEEARRLLPEHVFEELYECIPSDDGGNPFGLQHIDACAGAELSNKEPVAFGWDLAKAKNFSVGIGIDDEGTVCRFERFQDGWEGTFERVINTTGDCPALVDSTPGSVGDPILDRLHGDGRDNFEGYPFTTSNKQTLMLELAAAIQKREVAFPNGVIRDELDAFEYETRGGRVIYSASEGMHDDCVDSLALALYCKRTHRPHVLAVAAPMGLMRGGTWLTA